MLVRSSQHRRKHWLERTGTGKCNLGGMRNGADLKRQGAGKNGGGTRILTGQRTAVYKILYIATLPSLFRGCHDKIKKPSSRHRCGSTGLAKVLGKPIATEKKNQREFTSIKKKSRTRSKRKAKSAPNQAAMEKGRLFLKRSGGWRGARDARQKWHRLSSSNREPSKSARSSWACRTRD